MYDLTTFRGVKAYFGLIGDETIAEKLTENLAFLEAAAQQRAPAYSDEPEVMEEFDAEEILQKTLQVPGVVDVVLDEEKVSLITTHNFIRYRNVNYHIGQVRIDILFQAAEVRIHNLTWPKLEKRGISHPHVWERGRVCLGEITRDVPRLLSKLMLPELAQVLLIFLRNGVYSHRMPFPKVSDEVLLGYAEQDEIIINAPLDDLKKKNKKAKSAS